MNAKNLIIILFFFLLIKEISAIGIGPVFTNIDFEPNLSVVRLFKIYNTDKKNFTAIIHFTGDIDEFMSLERNTISFNRSDNAKEVRFNFSFPRDLPPGNYQAKIYVNEKFEELEGDSVIGAVLGVSHKIFLTVPKHGKYIKEIIELENQNLIIKIKNIGVKNITSLKGNIIFLDNEKEALNITIDEQRLLSDEIFNSTYYLRLNPGIYQGIIVLNYDNQTKEIKNIFVVGEKRILIKDINITDFKAGEIGQINLLLESNWNKEIRNVFADIEVYRDNELVRGFQTPMININKTFALPLFWNTQGVGSGIYDLKIMLNYEDKITEEIIMIELEDEKVKIKKERISANRIIFAGILVIILIINTYYYLKKKN